MKTIILYFSMMLMLLSYSCSEKCEPGPITESCVCPTVVMPVCGCDKITYLNSCEAACAGITEFEEGSCDD